jgi:hypothetical protein
MLKVPSVLSADCNWDEKNDELAPTEVPYLPSFTLFDSVLLHERNKRKLQAEIQAMVGISKPICGSDVAGNNQQQVDAEKVLSESEKKFAI